MTDKSAAELAREAEATRARLVATADSIRNKMTPGQLLDEFTGLFANSGGTELLRNLKAQVRDNPLPLTVIGASLAWLMLGRGASAAITAPGYTPGRGRGQHNDATGAGTGAMTSDTAAEVVGGAAEKVSGMASSAADTVSDVARGATETLTKTATGTADMATRASRSGLELLRDRPLAVAAVGLAVGAAIGAMLPDTQLEDEQLGGYRDKLRDSAEKNASEAKRIAAQVYEAGSDEAERQASSEGTLADKVSGVVKSAADAADESVRRKLSDTGLAAKNEP